MPSRLFIAAAVASLLQIGVAEQVRLEVRVTDDDGRPVAGLQISDFEVRDDGRLQTITTFTPIDSSQQAVPSPSTPRASPASTTTETAPTPGRAAVIVLDDLHVAATNTPRVMAAVRAFIDTALHPEDSVALVFTSGAAGGGQDFTTERRLVMGAVDRFRGQKLRSATVERMQDPRLNLKGVLSQNADPSQPDRTNRARITLDSLRRIGDALVPFEDQRPLVLFVSEGPEYDNGDGSPFDRSDQRTINRGLRDAVENLNRVNAVVFAIDPRGVATGNPDQIQASSVFESVGFGSAAIANESLRALGVVQALSANTGGFTMLWRPDMSRDFRRVVVADNSYYLIGYDAPSTNRGKYHTLAVTVRKPRVQVRARSGYFLPARR